MIIGLSVVLFSLGVIGVLVRRNAIIIFMSVELMLNAANLAFIAFARSFNQIDGQMFVFFVMVVAAAEVAVGLALIVAIFRTKQQHQRRRHQPVEGLMVVSDDQRAKLELLMHEVQSEAPQIFQYAWLIIILPFDRRVDQSSSAAASAARGPSAGRR